ncbi:MAG: S8 family serine peptidase [Thermomicrobiales bacterium]
MLRALPLRAALCLVLVCAAFVVDLLPPAPRPVAANAVVLPPDLVPNELLIGFAPGTPDAVRAAVVARRGGRIVRHLAGADAALVELPALRPLGEAAATFAADGAVRYVEPNYRYRIATEPNDPKWADGSLWGLERIGAPAAWETTTGSADLVVGVIDSGIDQTHPDLVANIWTAPNGWSVQGCGPGSHGYRSIHGVTGCAPGDTADDQGHGTQVAGVIGARGDNGQGVVGVNWNVKLMSLKAVDADGVVALSDAVAVIEYAIAAKQAGANLRVLNVSWGGYGRSEALLAALEAANAAGILVVTTAGNNGTNLDLTPLYPASYGAAPDYLPNVIAVTGVNRNDVRQTAFGYGINSVHIAAPGEGIWTTLLGGQYGSSDGASLATAYVSGAAALLLSAPGLGDLGTAALKTRLVYCGDPLATATSIITNSRLNLLRALRFTDCTLPIHTLAVTASPAEGGEVTLAPGGTTHAAGTELALTATAAPGYRHTGWRIDTLGRDPVNPLHLTVFRDHAIVATFERETVGLTLTGSPGGQVSATPPGGAYAPGTVVEIAATPNGGFAFVNWTIDGSEISTENPLALTLDRDRSAHATFAAAPSPGTTHQLTLTASAGGSATASAPGPYTTGTRVTLTATPEQGFVFTGWTLDDAPAGLANPLVVTMNAAHVVRANFAAGRVLHLSWTQGGNVAVDAPTWPGDSPYPDGTLLTLTAATSSDSVFTGWTIDGAFAGWANPLTLTLGTEHTVVANFARRKHFTDLPPGPPPYEAISQLAARLIILGYNNGNFGPDDTTQRAQMAALIARAMGWDREEHGNPFTDDNGIDPNLWRNVGTLAFYNVAHGYDERTFGTFDSVLRAQVISFITRGMVAKGRWVRETTDDPTLYPNVPASTGHRLDLVTYYRNAGAVPGTVATQPWPEWDEPSTRGWFAEALWQAIDGYYGVDRVP